MNGPELSEILEDWVSCTRCPLHETRNNVVFGDGNPDADILIVGEAPGEEEDINGDPYVGDSGGVLNSFLDGVVLDRYKDVFLTNVVGCRPTQEGKDYNGRLKIENRQPNRVEREACRPRLHEIIYRVDPYLIITLGGVALSAVMGKTITIASVRGKMLEATIPGRHFDLTYAVMPMLHPSFLLRNQNKSEEGPWDMTAGDFAESCIVIDILREAYRGVEIPDRENHD